MRSLIVDDSKPVRSILKSILEEMGHLVEEAASGEEALEILEQENNFDLAIIDWVMPEMDGKTLIEKMRGNSDYDNTQIIMVTSANDLDNVTEALSSGANEYIMKPFTKEMLEEKLEILDLSIPNK